MHALVFIDRAEILEARSNRRDSVLVRVDVGDGDVDLPTVFGVVRILVWKKGCGREQIQCEDRFDTGRVPRYAPHGSKHVYQPLIAPDAQHVDF